MQLLKHFKELTLHPKNAEELKGLILQLAVQGKLTRQWREENPDVEPASVLLEKIEVEKDVFIKETKRRKEKAPLSITKEEEPFDLPTSWEWSRMLNICHLITDGTHHTPKYLDNGIPFLSVKNLSQGGIDFSDTKFISLEEHKGLIKRCNPEYEDVLLTKIGTTGIAKVIDIKTDFSIFVSVALLKIAKQNLFPYFIEHCINSPFIKQQSKDGTEGVGNKNLVLRKIKDFLIPIPPLEEQKAIVEVVNQLFAEVEQLEAFTKERIQLKADFVTSALNRLTQAAEQDTASQWAFLQQHFGTFFTEKSTIKKLREGILQLAVQGKLTHNWRAAVRLSGVEVESATTLLEKIKAEKEQLIKAGKIKKEKPLPEISEEEIPYELPEGWVWCRLGDLAQKLGAGSTPSGGKSSYSENGIMFLRSQNIHNYFLKLEQVAYITEGIHEKMKGTKVQAKDLLLNITGGSIGRCALVQDSFDTANVSQHVAIIRLVDMDLRFYMHSLIVSKAFQETIMDVQVGVSREGLSMTKLKLFLVPLPPFEEQKAIVQKVNSLVALCDKLEQEIETHQITQEQWMQSCLREAVNVKAADELHLNIAAEPIARYGNK